jgi:hypothetical protein
VWPELRETFASYPLFDWNTVRVALEREHAAALAGQPAGKLRPATASQNQENDTATSAQHRSASPAQAAHNADFTMVNWFGVEYQFALGIQALAVRALWEEWERTGLGLHQDTIREAIDPERDKFRMDNAFRNHRAFGTMITSCGDGRYKLTPPQTEPAAVKNRNRKNRTKTPKSRQKRV